MQKNNSNNGGFSLLNLLMNAGLGAYQKLTQYIRCQIGFGSFYLSNFSYFYKSFNKLYNLHTTASSVNRTSAMMFLMYLSLHRLHDSRIIDRLASWRANYYLPEFVFYIIENIAKRVLSVSAKHNTVDGELINDFVLHKFLTNSKNFTYESFLKIFKDVPLLSNIMRNEQTFSNFRDELKILLHGINIGTKRYKDSIDKDTWIILEVFRNSNSVIHPASLQHYPMVYGSVEKSTSNNLSIYRFAINYGFGNVINYLIDLKSTNGLAPDTLFILVSFLQIFSPSFSLVLPDNTTGYQSLDFTSSNKELVWDHYLSSKRKTRPNPRSKKNPKENGGNPRDNLDSSNGGKSAVMQFVLNFKIEDIRDLSSILPIIADSLKSSMANKTITKYIDYDAGIV